jgi:Holliday junction resolvasome RuvABC ATP-dependent DNA helicase subunit
MEQLELTGFLSLMDEVCGAITKANVGNVSAETMSLQERFHYELLLFSVYLADADGSYTAEEIGTIEQYLKISTERDKLKELKKKEQVDETFGNRPPSVLKYMVLADAGRKLPGNPYGGQTAMICYDTFRLFGQHMLSVQEKEAGEVMLSRFTRYIEGMEQFIKSFAVWYVGSGKRYQPREIPEPETVTETPEEKSRKLDELLEDLNHLVGLKQVKHQVNSQVNLIRVQQMRREQGLKVSDVSRHMVFMGNPGTGKTTVARKLAEIYKYLGILPKGQLIEVDRSGLVRGYVGQTATQTSEVIESALGGILFIDEAYTLTVNKGQGDFGQEAVDTLLKAMEDHRSELVVIMAGYTDLMESFLASNPGLRSRFRNIIVFDDYSAEELMQILQDILKSQDYVFSDAAQRKAAEMLGQRVANKPEHFANARDVRNFAEGAIARQATRLVEQGKGADDRKLLSTIEPEDLPEDWD